MRGCYEVCIISVEYNDIYTGYRESTVMRQYKCERFVMRLVMRVACGGTRVCLCYSRMICVESMESGFKISRGV